MMVSTTFARVVEPTLNLQDGLAAHGELLH